MTGEIAMADPIRIGIIGFDTSHVPAFARLLNDPGDPHHVPGARVVAGYPSFSPDLESSASRVEGFVRDVQEPYGVAIVDSVEALLEQVDAVLLESVDGRRHLEEARPVIAARKPMFIDKPLAHNYADAAEIARLAAQAGCPVFSSSSLRYDANLSALAQDAELGDIIACDAFSPATLDPTNPGLFWYGVHGVEILYTFMGTGCESVIAHHTNDYDLVVGRWPGERLATMRGIRAGARGYGVAVFGSKKVGQAQYSPQVPMYARLLGQILPFFGGAPAPVPMDETLEIMAFMQASLQSEERGAPVRLSDIRG
jgi:predicted dehydrogenase